MDSELLEYLQKVKFDKYFDKLKRKLKDKKIIIYGTGALFQTIKEKYDLSCFNIIGVSDMKYKLSQEGEEFLGYKIIPKYKMAEYAPDYVVVATLNYVGILQEYMEDFKDTKIKFIPLVRKPILGLLKDVWCK